MTRSYLPLNAHRAFETAARYLTLTKAAKKLNITHAAVSQQVKELEELQGSRLFTRVSRGLQLTLEGVSLLPVLTQSIDTIVGTLVLFLSDRERATLKVGVLGTF